MQPMINGLNKTWNDATTGTGILRSALNFGMTVGVCLLMMLLACAILVYAPKLFVPVTTILSIALVTLPIYGATFFDNLAKKVMHFKFRKELIFKCIFNASLLELSTIIVSITPTTPITPPRRTA
jgi:hypothetical protein